MTNVTGQQPFPQELFRVFLEEHALVHKLQQRGAFKVVDELPTEDIDIYSVYLLHNGSVLEQWIYYEGNWEYIGISGIDYTIYQEKNDSSLQTTNKTVVGAINEVLGKTFPVDDQLSTTSKNPVQNNILTREIRATAQRIVEIERELSEAIINSDTENKASISALESGVDKITSNLSQNKVDKTDFEEQKQIINGIKASVDAIKGEVNNAVEFLNEIV